jgi:hypothetical protein
MALGTGANLLETKIVARYSDLPPTGSSVELLQYPEVVIRTHVPFSSTESMFLI